MQEKCQARFNGGGKEMPGIFCGPLTLVFFGLGCGIRDWFLLWQQRGRGFFLLLSGGVFREIGCNRKKKLFPLSLSPSVASSEDGKSPCVIRIFFLLRIFPPFFPLFCAGVRSSAADGAAFFSIEYPLLLPPCLCWGRMEIALFASPPFRLLRTALD